MCIQIVLGNFYHTLMLIGLYLIDTLHDAHAKVNMGTQKPFVKPFVKPIKEDERFYKYCSLLKSSHEVILLVAFFSFCLPLLVLPLLGFICSFCEWTRECYISCSYVRLHIVRSLPATHILSSLFSLLSLSLSVSSVIRGELHDVLTR